MPTFPSLEWAKELRATLNARESYRKAAKGLTAEFVFHIEPSGALEEATYLAVSLSDGECVGVDELDGLNGSEPDFVLRGLYDDWASLLRGEFDPIQGVLTRRLEVKGSVAKLMRYVAAAKELGRATQAVDTTFL